MTRSIGLCATLDPGFKRVRTKYERFLGNPGFFEQEETIKWANAGNNAELRRLFRECYKTSLRNIGYPFIDEKRVRHYYSLIFASADEKGLELWNKANSIEPDNQRMLF